MPTIAPSPHHFVVFTVDEQAYALPLDQVTRTTRMAALTPMPESAPWIAGMVNVAGRLTPVIDLRQRLGFERKPPGLSDRLLILGGQGQDCAWIVDQVSEVLEWPVSALETPPDRLFPAGTRLATGVIQQGETLILVLDSTRLG
jgi:purine-binding chemotaxis protein CheW